MSCSLLILVFLNISYLGVLLDDISLAFFKGVSMVKIKKISLNINEDIDYEFKKIASKRFGFERGWYSKAINEALVEWIEKHGND